MPGRRGDIAALASAVALCAACGGSAPAAAPHASPADVTAASPAAEQKAPATAAAEPTEPEGPPTLTVVAGNLQRDLPLLTARVRQTGASAPVSLQMLQGLSAVVFGPALARQLDWSAPALMMVSGEDDDPGEARHVAVAATLSAPPDLEQQLARELELADGPGELRRLRARPGSAIALGDKLACALRGPDSGGAHLVCGTTEKSLRALGPRAASALDAMRDAPTLGVQADASFVRRAVEADDADDADTSAGERLGERMLAALRDVGAELRLQDARATGVLDVAVADEPDNPLSAALLHPVADTDLPPRFPMLPPDATLALSLRGVEPETMRRAAPAVWNALLEDEGEEPGVPAVVAELRKVLLRGGPLLVAYGLDPEAALERYEQVRGDAPEDVAARRRALQGWWAFGVPEPWDRWKDVLESLLDIAEEQRAARAQAAASAGGSSKKTASPEPSDDPFDEDLFRGRLRPRDRLPSDAMALEWRSRPEPGYRPGPGEGEPIAHVTHLLVGANESHVWIVAAESRSIAVAKLRALLAGDNATEAQRRFFRPQGVGEAAAVGYVTRGALVGMGLEDDDPTDLPEAARTLRELAASKGRGTDRVGLVLTTDPGDGDTGRVRLEARLPDATLLSLFDVVREGLGDGK